MQNSGTHDPHKSCGSDEIHAHLLYYIRRCRLDSNTSVNSRGSTHGLEKLSITPIFKRDLNISLLTTS